MGSKRGRFLIRQPRIKKESELMEHQTHSSPDVEESTFHHQHHHGFTSSYSSLLTVPPKIERHSSEPSRSTTNLLISSTSIGSLTSPTTISSSPHLLTVPQPSFLVKQHSHPLLPSQSQSPPISSNLTLQRQLSHPSTQTTSSALLSAPVSLTTQLSADSIITSSMQSTLAQYVTGTGQKIKSEDGILGSSLKSNSPTVVIVTDPLSNVTTDLPTIRVKNEELQRSISSPQILFQTQNRDITLENARSSHCPVVRPGPALGCNFCWNTIDAHGRILRRKTKYHCPECQTNLCIVPCFQEFHERQANEVNSSTNSGSGGANSSNENSKLSSLSYRHFPKTGSL